MSESGEKEGASDNDDQTKAAEAAAAEAVLEYNEFAEEINALSVPQALRVCEIEGIAPRDGSLLGLRAALLLHFCGPPPKLDASSKQKASKVTAKKASSSSSTAVEGKRLGRLAARPSSPVVPIWCWRKMAELVGEPEVEDAHVRERLASMPWHEAKVACARLGIETNNSSGLLAVREKLAKCLLETDDSVAAAATRLTPIDYKIIVKHMDEEQSIAATKKLEIVPIQWTEKLCKAALLSHLSPPPMLEELTDKNGKRGVGAMMKAMAAGISVVKDKGMSPFEKWRNFKKAKMESVDNGVARLVFEEIDADRSGELTVSELREVAQKLGGGVEEGEIEEAMMEMDQTGDGKIGVAEFEVWWSSARASDNAWTRLINKRERLEQERIWLQELFDLIDADGGGTLDKEEVGELVADLGLALNEIELDEAFKELDEDGGGDVDFDEFWTWFQNAPKTGSGLAAEMQRGLKRSEMLRNARDAMFAAFDSGSEAQRHLRELFDRLDEDGGRGIDADELTDLANGLRLNMTRAEIEEAVGQIDATNSGEIEFHEFYQWWISDSRGAAGRLRSKLKLSAFLAKKAGSLLVAVELADDSEGLQASEQYMANILAQSFSRTHVLQGNSLGVFSPDSPLRILCNEILNYKHTERALICLIFINMIIMAFPVADSGLKATAAATNLAIGVAFTAETTMRIIQLGLFRGVTFDDGTTANTSYLTSWWNAFDLGIISLWWFVLLFAAIFGWDVRVVNSVSVFRSVRSLRFFPHVRQILSSIKQSTIMILDVTYIFAMLFIIYGVAMQTLLGGALTQTCAAQDVNTSSPFNCSSCVGEPLGSQCPSSLGCAASGLECYSVAVSPTFQRGAREDHTTKYGFDSIGPALMTMYSMATLDDWQNIVNKFRAVTQHSVWFIWAPIASFVIVVGICAVNIFLAGIAYSYHTVRRQLKQFETEQNANDTVAMMILASPDEIEEDAAEEQDFGDPTFWIPSLLVYKCRGIMQDRRFDSGCLTVVIINIFLMTTEHHNMGSSYADFLFVVDIFFTAVYVFEAFVKICGMGGQYFASTMCRIDLLIVISAIVSYLSMLVDAVIDIKALVAIRLLRLLRLLRVGRIGRLLMRSESVRYMLAKAFSSRAAVASLAFLIVFILAVSALGAMQIFGQCFPDGSRPNFSSFGDAFATTFVVFSTDSWSVLVFEFQECSRSALPATVFFITLQFILYFLLSELFVAVFIENFQREEDDKRKQQIAQYLEASEDGVHNALEISSKLSMVNTFLSAKTKTARRYGFDQFVNSVTLTSQTAEVIAENLPGLKQTRSCSQWMFDTCFRRHRIRSAAAETTEAPTIRMDNPLIAPQPGSAASLEEPTVGGPKTAAGVKTNNPLLDSQDDEVAEADELQGTSIVGEPVAAEEWDETESFRDKSLGLFAVQNSLRQLAIRCIQSDIMRYTVLVLLLVDIIQCGRTQAHGFLRNGQNVDPFAFPDRAILGLVLGGLFVETSIHVVAKGLLFTPNAYLSTPTGIFEFVCLILQFHAWWTGSSVFLVIIFIRVLLMVERTKTIVDTIWSAAPALLPLLVLIAATFLIFSIIGMSLFMGKLWHCSSDPALQQSDCQAANGTWVNKDYSYDNIFSAAESLFIVWSLQGWTSLMQDLMDAPQEVGMAPEVDSSFTESLVFHFCFIMWTYFVLTNLFVSLLADFFASSTGNQLMTAGQRDWQYINLVLYRLQPIRTLPNSQWRLTVFRLVESDGFRHLVDVFTLLNVAQLVGVKSVSALPSLVQSDETDWAANELVVLGQTLVLVVYILEALLKAIAHGPLTYGRESKVELFVLVIMILATSSAYIEVLSQSSMWLLEHPWYDPSDGWRYIQTLQFVRVVRLAQMLGRIPGVKKLYYVIRVSIPEVLNLCFCTFIVIFVCSVFAMRLCGGISHDSIFNEYDNFDTVENSMRFLFQITTGQSFKHITHECVAASDYPFAVKPFFFTYFMLTNFIFLSLFVALLLDNLALMGSDNFAISDVDIQLFRETWLQNGLEPHELLPLDELKAFVEQVPGSLSFIPKSDPFWFNRLMLELDLTPEIVELNSKDSGIGLNRLMQALCQMRFSSRCLDLNDEVAKSNQLRAHLQNHAGVLICVGVRAWLAKHNPPQEEIDYDGGKRWRIAVQAAKLLQMSAVISTQRITSENVVAENLDALQRLVNRKTDRQQARELQKANNAARAKRQKMQIQQGLTGPTQGRSRKIQREQSRAWSASHDNAISSSDVAASLSDSRSIKWKERNAFMTRRTWHANVGVEGRGGVAVDTTGDGELDAIGYDTTGDGQLDAFDTNRDGKINALDTTGDGRVDAVDTTGDGRLDAFDTTGNGRLDAFDTKGDGRLDAFDTTGDGRIDGLDTTGDGEVDTTVET